MAKKKKHSMLRRGKHIPDGKDFRKKIKTSWNISQVGLGTNKIQTKRWSRRNANRCKIIVQSKAGLTKKIMAVKKLLLKYR